jgi:hypothetical protein
VPVIAWTVEVMAGRGRECAIRVLAAIDGGGSVEEDDMTAASRRMVQSW